MGVLRSLLCLLPIFSLAAAAPPAKDESPYKLDPHFPQLPPEIKLAAVSGIAIDAKGNIHVFHRGEPPILVFDADGKFLRSIGQARQFASAHGLRFDTDGNLWTTDNANHTVHKFSPEGKLLLTLGVENKPGVDESHFNKPTDIAFAANGDFFISDGYGNSRVVKFNKEGRFLRAWGKKGTGDGEFNLPHAIRIDSKGNVYVGDRENNRIQVFDQDGKFIRKMDGMAPYGLFIAPDDTLFVADGRANRVLHLSNDGKPLAAWGEKGKGPGQFQMPHTVAVGGDGAIYVGEVDGKRVQKFLPAVVPALKQGDRVDLGGRPATVTKLDTLPFVENDYSKRFRFDSPENPKLKTLREKYKLDEVVSAGKDEFDRQVLLLDWANTQFHKFGRPTSPARGELEILAANEAGHTFFCAHYADVFVSAAASMGWIDRSLALRRPDAVGSGSTEHSSTEIWSNQFRKWVMLDPTFAMYVEKDGVPLNAFELRQEWFYNDGRDLTFVLNKERKRYRKSDLPVFRARYEGFGDLSLDAGALNPYAFIGYIPNNNLMDGGPDYGKMFITQDKLCEGTKWHKRDVPKEPAIEPYFPINQAALTLTPEGQGLRVSVKTMTPNFRQFLSRIDGGEWKPGEASFVWLIHDGANRMEVKSVNQLGVEGAVSAAEVLGGHP